MNTALEDEHLGEDALDHTNVLSSDHFLVCIIGTRLAGDHRRVVLRRVLWLPELCAYWQFLITQSAPQSPRHPGCSLGASGSWAGFGRPEPLGEEKGKGANRFLPRI